MHLKSYAIFFPSCLVLEVGSESSCQRCETLISQNKAKYDSLQSFSKETADEQSKFCVGCGYPVVNVPNIPQTAFVSVSFFVFFCFDLLLFLVILPSSSSTALSVHLFA